MSSCSRYKKGDLVVLLFSVPEDTWPDGKYIRPGTMGEIVSISYLPPRKHDTFLGLFLCGVKFEGVDHRIIYAAEDFFRPMNDLEVITFYCS